MLKFENMLIKLRTAHVIDQILQRITTWNCQEGKGDSCKGHLCVVPPGVNEAEMTSQLWLTCTLYDWLTFK